MAEFSIVHILVSLVISVAASLLAVRYLRYRNDKIKQQIEDIEYHEGFLEKLSKGNLKLLRISFGVLFSCLFLFFGASGILTFTLLLDDFQIAKNILICLSMAALFFSSGLCFLQAKSIVQISNFSETKKTLSEKKKKLESKI